MKVPVEFLGPLTFPTNAVEDTIGKGNEVEIHYNPTPHWTLKANVVKQESMGANIAPEINQWIAERLPVWQSIIDPTTGRSWFTERYNNAQTAEQLLASAVVGPLALAQALEGKSLPQIRKYRVNVSTSYRLAGITDHRILKRFNVGGAARWEDKGAIGFHGLQQLPAQITAFDASRPIWDKSHLNLDAFVSYRTPFFSRKVTANWQFYVRNLTEDGRLQPIAADPDGQYSAYRIIDPRQFILTATLEF